MRYVKMILDTEYVGTENEYCMETNMNDRELDATLLEEARDNAESYEYLVLGWDTSPEEYAEDNGMDIEEVEEMIEGYYQTAIENSYWEEISKEDYEEYLKNN